MRLSRPPLFAVIAALVACSSDAETPAARVDLAQPWAEGAPVDVAMSAAGLDQAAADCAAIPRCRSLLVARHGVLVAEHYFADSTPDTMFDVRSVTKSVVGALTGIALRDHVFPSLDESIGTYLGATHELDDTDRAVHLANLTTMTSGYAWNDDDDYNPWILSDDHVQFLLDRPQAAAPGSTFDYNSAAVHVLGVSLQVASGMPLTDYADAELFRPLAIDHVAWEELEDGTVNGGAGIQLEGRELLKLGQLYLQHGFSGAVSVVPESWVDEVTRPVFSWRDDYGPEESTTYGMLWWVSDHAPDRFFAWGYGGQFIYVVPSLDLVAVTTTDWTAVSGDPGGVHGLEDQIFGVLVGDVVPAAD